MVRALLGLISVFGAFGVTVAALNAREPLAALKAIGVGVALLLFVTALGLSDLIHVTHEVRGAVHALDETNADVRDEITYLRRTLLTRDDSPRDEL